MTIKRTYYKGTLNSQFSTKNRSKLGPVNHQAQILLEPRFRLYDAVEISESDIPKTSELDSNAYIFQNSNAEVEIYSELNPSGMKRTSESVLLILNNADEKGAKSNPINNYLRNSGNEKLSVRKFHAEQNSQTHGKISGLAYFTITEQLDADGKIVLPTIKKEVKPQNSISLPLVYKKISHFGNETIDLSKRKGCAPLLNTMKSIGLNPAGLLGSPSGGSSSGCMNILKWLGILGFLIAALSMLMNTCSKGNKQVLPAPIHDTIFQEVIKTVTDTLTITKSDTVSFVDSTIKTTYEMVSLPNVQFYTNSRVLLPGSAIDLQKLAEYLLKNDNLNATIYGHTDNVGKPSDNLKLSQERAESVKQFLTSLGVAPERLNASGMGDTKPKADNSKEEGRMLNRRVEVKLMEQEKVEVRRTKVEEN